MNTTFKEQMSIDDISRTPTTQQSTSTAQNAPSQERAHEYKQRIAESVQTQYDSAGRNDTTPQSDRRRVFPQDHRNNTGNAWNITHEHSTATNDNEYSASVTDSCETAPTAAEPKRRGKKAQPVNTSPICDMQMLTPDDIMRALRLSRSTVYNMIKRGEIPSIKIGNMLRVKKASFEHWLEQHTAAEHTV
jgi:excisionase family DNA binding protein